MANFGGLLRKMNGSVGDLTFKQVKGQTIVSEKVTQVSTPRTEPMMRQRCKWTNIGANKLRTVTYYFKPVEQ